MGGQWTSVNANVSSLTSNFVFYFPGSRISTSVFPTRSKHRVEHVLSQDTVVSREPRETRPGKGFPKYNGSDKREQVGEEPGLVQRSPQETTQKKPGFFENLLSPVVVESLLSCN